ncbi:CHAT domain-containing protein [Streptomyces sp. BI20]|uniref:CHAT domain-containing protein n=1 Tax=Streptomyces sp. BI20 TaxID=3403460 RepID=UPI003C78D9C2
MDEHAPGHTTDLAGTVSCLKELATRLWPEPAALTRGPLLEPRVTEALERVERLLPVPFDDLDASLVAGVVWWLRYNALGSKDLGAEAMMTMEMRLGAVAVRAPDRIHPEIAVHFVHRAPACCVTLRLLDALEHHPEDSERMLDAALETSRLLDTGPPWRCHSHAAHLSHRARAHGARFDRHGHTEDLTELVRLARDADALVLAADPSHLAVRHVYAQALVGGLRLGKPVTDLDRAIEVGDEILAAAGDRHPHLGPFHLDQARARRLRTEWRGTPEDLEAAIHHYRQAVAVMTANPHPDLVQAMSTLGHCLRVRYERLGHRADLDEAVTVIENARRLPTTHPAAGGLVHAHLAVARYSRYVRTRDPADVDGAVTASEAALRSLDPGSPEEAGIRADHARFLQVRAELGGDPAQEDAALTAADDTLAALARIGLDESIPAPAALAHLVRCDTLRARAARTGSAADAAEALAAARTALDHVRPDAAAHAAAHLAVADAHLLLAGIAESAGRDGAPDRAEAAAALRAAAAHDRAPAPLVAAARAAIGRNAARRGLWAEAADAYAQAVEHLLRIAPAALRRADREHRLTALRGLASDALACCLNADRVTEGVLLFERGRGVVLRQALDGRADLAEVDTLAPHLAARLRTLRRALAETETPDAPPADATGDRRTPARPAPGVLLDEPDLPEDPVHLRQWIEARIAQTITRIRTEAALPGFLAPPDLDTLAAATGPTGAAVVVNVSEFRSDAVLLRAGRPPEVVPLPLLTPGFVDDRTALLTASLDAALDPDTPEDPAAEAAIHGILADLWDAAAGPVLDALGHHTPADGPLTDRPRVWWCPAGALTTLPLHAAGHHDTRFGEAPLTVPDRVVSSYTPTLDSLVRAPARPRPDAGPARTLVVATATARGVPADAPHPDTEREAETVAALAPGPVDRLIGPDATRDRVEAALTGAGRVHFACHADTDPADPAAGRLRLADHATRPFDVTAISTLRPTDAEFAFLAACSTAAPGRRNPDEAVHLASGFRLAGFRQVVGTLWPLLGEPALPVVRRVHGAVAAEGPGVAAAALYEAVLDLRWNLPDRPSVWATHLHVGGLEPAAPRKETP